MIRASVSSNGKETFEYVEDDETVDIRIKRLREALHFVGMVLTLRKLSKKEDVHPVEEKAQEAGKDVRVRYGPLELNIG
jgi:hypothetical protein